MSTVTVHPSSDSGLLELLRAGGPMGVAELSTEIAVTPTAVRQRLGRRGLRVLKDTRINIAVVGNDHPLPHCRLSAEERRIPFSSPPRPLHSEALTMRAGSFTIHPSLSGNCIDYVCSVQCHVDACKHGKQPVSPFRKRLMSKIRLD